MVRLNFFHHLMAAVMVVGTVLSLPLGVDSASNGHDYADALAKSILFFEGQRSGKIPVEQRMKWRKDSGLLDGQQIGVDLVGGYYDAGDNVKFGFPMAYTTTLLSWSVVEFSQYMGGEAKHAMEAIRWGTDYLLKATDEPNKVHAQVGNPYNDHNCWERPEDMDTARSVYSVDKSKPGSEVAAETAAALAAASMVFQSTDTNYASSLLTRSMAVFDFADRYRGSYADSLGQFVCPFYCDFDGYQDELVWAAAWIYKASNNPYYLNYVHNNIQNLVSDGDVGEFGWDNKHAGIYVLLSKILEGSDPLLKKADEFICTVLPESPTRGVEYSPGGLLFKSGGGNLQHSTALSLLLVVYADYLTPSKRSVSCGQVTVPFTRLVEVAKGQADYILGSNPLGLSYMVGYGNNYPKRIHHRGSSLPSIEKQPSPIRCKEGTPYYLSPNPNPNMLIGAIVGGPTNTSDTYHDSRPMSVESEPMTYLNAAMVGLLAYLTAHG